MSAGHVLESEQGVLRWKGITALISGDYKRRRDPTCPLCGPAPCSLFVSEATFGLPVFRFPEAANEVAKLLDKFVRDYTIERFGIRPATELPWSHARSRK